MSNEANAEASKDVILPITRESLETFIEGVAVTFGLPEKNDDVWRGVATAIMHMPAHRAYAELGYFGNFARKELANKAAFSILEDLRKKLLAEQPTGKTSGDEQPVSNA